MARGRMQGDKRMKYVKPELVELETALEEIQGNRKGVPALRDGVHRRAYDETVSAYEADE
jgi:hypothetical protein